MRFRESRWKIVWVHFWLLIFYAVVASITTIYGLSREGFQKDWEIDFFILFIITFGLGFLHPALTFIAKLFKPGKIELSPEYISLPNAKLSDILPIVNVNWESMTKVVKKSGGGNYEFVVGDKKYRLNLGCYSFNDVRTINLMINEALNAYGVPMEEPLMTKPIFNLVMGR